MRKHCLITKSTGEVLQIMQWGDDRDFPSNITIEEDKEIATVDVEFVIDLGNLYNKETEEVITLPPIEPIHVLTDVEILQKRQDITEQAINDLIMMSMM